MNGCARRDVEHTGGHTLRVWSAACTVAYRDESRVESAGLIEHVEGGVRVRQSVEADHLRHEGEHGEVGQEHEQEAKREEDPARDSHRGCSTHGPRVTSSRNGCRNELSWQAAGPQAAPTYPHRPEKLVQ